MISSRSLLLVFGTVLFFLVGFGSYGSYLLDFNMFGPAWTTAAQRAWMAHHTLWFALGFLYLLLTTFSVKRDLARRKRTT